MHKVGFFAIILSLFSLHRLNACGGTGLPSYGGQISYSIDSGNPYKANFVVTMYFLNNEVLSNDSVVLNWGDSTQSAIYAVQVDPDSISFANSDVMPYDCYRHTYMGSHTYASVAPGGGCYFPWLTNTYRPYGVVNVNYNDSYLVGYTLTAQVCIDSSANSSFIPPVLAPVDMLLCTSGESFTNATINSIPKGDSVVCQLIAPLIIYQSQNNYEIIPCGAYELPSQWCGGTSDSSFAVNSSTGLINWPGPICYDTFSPQTLIYDVTTQYNTYRNGKFIGSVMRDQLLYTITGQTSAIKQVQRPGNLSVYPNPAVSQLNVVLPDNAGNGQITLYDITGREVFSSKTETGNLQVLDISGLPGGAYLLTYRDAAGMFSQKVVKQTIDNRH